MGGNDAEEKQVVIRNIVEMQRDYSDRANKQNELDEGRQGGTQGLSIKTSPSSPHRRCR